MTECADLARVLGSLIFADPIPANSEHENNVCNFMSGASTDSLEADAVLAPHSPGAGDVTLMCKNVRVGTEEPAVFLLASKGSTPLNKVA